MSKVHTKDRLCQHYRSIGIDQVNSARFASLVDKWINKSGPEWTVKRLKSLEAAFKAHVANPSDPLVIPEGWSTRVSRRGRLMFADGLVQRMMDQTSPRGLKMAIAFFRSAQIVVLEKPLPHQVDKFVSGITTKQPESAEFFLNMIGACIDSVNAEEPYFLKRSVQDEERFFRPLSHWPNRPGKASPVFDEDNRRDNFPSISRKTPDAKSIDNLIVDTDWNALWRKYPTEVSTCLVGDSNYLPHIEQDNLGKHVDIPNGKITLIPEPAAKLRAVANPCLSIQALGEPLKRRLYSLCLRIGAIYTDDQMLAQSVIANWISEGSKVWCFDASAFTDRFPVKVQRDLLVSLQERTDFVTQFDIDVLDVVISKGWRMPGKEKGIVKYAVGQPMGFGPSFHLACLGHYYVALTAASLNGVDVKDVDNYVTIVGDDIVIRHEGVAHSYRQIMTGLGVEINMAKSVISDRYAEFCGKLISENGPLPSIKTRMITSQDQLIKTLEFYGVNGFDNLFPHEQVWALKAILPSFLGGIGFKPDGMSYAKYLNLLNVDKISKKLLLHDLKQHLHAVASLDVEATLETISQSYDVIAGDFADVLRIAQRIDANDNNSSETPRYSEWSGLPYQPGYSTVSPITVKRPSASIYLTPMVFLPEEPKAKAARLEQKAKLLKHQPSFGDIIDSAIRADINRYSHNVGDSHELRTKIPDVDRYADPVSGYINLDSHGTVWDNPKKTIETHSQILEEIAHEQSDKESESDSATKPRSDSNALTYLRKGEGEGGTFTNQEAKATSRSRELTRETVERFFGTKAKRPNREDGNEP